MKSDINFVQQNSDVTCVHACLAMVTGIPLAEVIHEMGRHPLSLTEEFRFLVRHGVFPRRSPDGLFAYPGVYAATMPSLNKLGTTHRVVAVREDDEIFVLDPQSGRDNKQACGEPFDPWPDRMHAFQLTFMDYTLI